MNRLILTPQTQTSQDHFLITDGMVIEHIQKVLKLKVDDSLNLCLVDEGLGRGKITQMDRAGLQIEVTSRSIGVAARCNLIIALNRPPMMKRIIEHGTTLGIKSFHFIKAELSEKSYLQSKVLTAQEFTRYTDLGLAQSGSYYKRPLLKVSPYFKVPEVEKNTTSFVLDGKSTSDFSNITAIPGDFTLAIGPERGWTKTELEAFTAHNFIGINLGSSILRVEHALYYALGQITRSLVEG